MVARLYRALELIEAEVAQHGGLERVAPDALFPLQATALTPSLGGALLIPDREGLDDAFRRAAELTDAMRARFGAAPLSAYAITSPTLEALLGKTGP